MWARLLRIPRPYLYAGILFFASMGAYAINAQPFDLILLLVLGLLGLRHLRHHPHLAVDQAFRPDARIWAPTLTRAPS
ncbi:tripartite tricarboxylate transporter permease [Nonomuraea sp. NPDC049750]|uniref:tripartite tricarboxylate transporter permease n=1 Tax=Nonomuraea sp. NPDC049750 TaxID=3154738 RepID=UPI0033C53A70